MTESPTDREAYGRSTSEEMEKVLQALHEATGPIVEAIRRAGAKCVEYWRSMMAEPIAVTCDKCGAQKEITFGQFVSDMDLPKLKKKRVWLCPKCRGG